MSRKTALACLLALSALYCVAELVPGRFAVTDEVYFKAAGRNWAATGRFAAPELTGGNQIQPPVTEVFFAYPPLYPFFYGVYTKVAGFGPRICILYDLIIHLLLIWCGVGVARLVHGAPWGVAALCGALLVPLGTVGRPDELGIVLALGAALALCEAVPLRWGIPAAGVLLGLCCATSLGACLFLGSLAGWELMLRGGSHLRNFRNLAITALIAMIVAAACVAPILAAHPSAYRQLVLIATGQSVLANAGTGSGSPQPGFFHKWIEAVRYGPSYGILVAGCLIFCLLCRRLDKNPENTKYGRFAGVVLSLLLLIVMMPGKYFYLWFAGAWLFIACVALGWRILPSLLPSQRRGLLAFGAAVWLLAAMPYLRWKAILWTLPADQSLTANVQRVRDEVPAGAGVLTSEYWWALAGRNRVYDTTFSNPGPNAFAYVVLTGNGSGQPGKPGAPNVPLDEAQWRKMDDHLRAEPPSFLGWPLSRSAYGFGPYVLKTAE